MPAGLADGLRLGSALSPAGWGIRPGNLGSPVPVPCTGFGDIGSSRQHIVGSSADCASQKRRAMNAERRFCVVLRAEMKAASGPWQRARRSEIALARTAGSSLPGRGIDPSPASGQRDGSVGRRQPAMAWIRPLLARKDRHLAPRDGLLPNSLLQGAQSVLTPQHHLALLIQRDNQ
jgi:hypothetical protein